MGEQLENTLTAYKGPEFQQKLMWQLLVEPEYAEKTIPILAVEYFDDPNIKRLFLIMLEYIKAYAKVPNLQNQSITQAINEFKTPNNVIEEESLFAVIERIKLWNERILNQTLMHDGEAVQKATNEFIKQQEIRKFAEGVLVKLKSGEIKNKNFIAESEEKMHKISLIGNTEDDGIDATESLEKALRKEFRKTIPTGVAVIDTLTGGGLGKGEIGLILTPTGVGKTTLLTKIANTARENNYNVLQIIFEDTIEQIQRKHVTIWTGIPLSELDERNVEALQLSTDHINKMGEGKLRLKKFSQEDTTMRDIKDFILRDQKKTGVKYDMVVLDYLDCLESHKKTPDRNEAELVIVKSFEAMASDLDIPCWSAIQSNRTGIGAELVEAQQTGGSIKRIQKAHFFMSVAKTPDQQEASLANIRIIKARFAKDGQTFKDCIFNNDTMQIIIKDERYVGGASYNNKKKVTDEVIEENARKIEEHAKGGGLIHVLASNAVPDSPEDPLLGDMRNKFMEQQKTEIILTGDIGKLPDGLKEINFDNIHIQTERTDLTQDEINRIVEFANDVIKESEDILELEDKPIENALPDEQIHPEIAFHDKQIKNDAVSDGVNEGVGDGVRLVNEGLPGLPPPIGKVYYTVPKVDVKEEIFEWTGETFTTAKNENEVKYDDIKPKIVPEIVPEMKKTTSEIEKIDVNEAEKKLNIDPDEVTPAKKHVMDFLRGQRVNEIVNKKE
jgi:replicative DNA helicase